MTVSKKCGWEKGGCNLSGGAAGDPHCSHSEQISAYKKRNKHDILIIFRLEPRQPPALLSWSAIRPRDCFFLCVWSYLQLAFNMFSGFEQKKKRAANLETHLMAI